MFAMILLLYLQQGTDVTLDGASLRGSFRDRRACEAAAVRARGAVPIPQGYDAAWHDALCTKVAAGVRVNGAAPLALDKLLDAHPPRQCQDAGAWRRLAELCRRP